MRSALLLGAVASVLLAPATAVAQPTDGPDQTIDGGQAVATDRKALTAGHVDLGPTFVDGDWTLMVHDDSSDPSVWRDLDRTVFQVSDKARLPVPDDPAYAFIGTPGAQVFVVPQVQNADVPWVGWNTQDPEVMETVDAGVTLSLSSVDGPGELFVYLQAGNFGAADVLWDSTKDGAQDIWVDVNTHTHANWVFTEPGVYLVQVEATADLVDGRTVSDTRTLRFAVGDNTDADSAFTAEANETAAPVTSAPAAAAPSGDGPPVGFIVIGVVALGLVVGVVVVVTRGRAAKRRALDGTGR